jgi:hypothetical protein
MITNLLSKDGRGPGESPNGTALHHKHAERGDNIMRYPLNLVVMGNLELTTPARLLQSFAEDERGECVTTI